MSAAGLQPRVINLDLVMARGLQPITTHLTDPSYRLTPLSYPHLQSFYQPANSWKNFTAHPPFCIIDFGSSYSSLDLNMGDGGTVIGS